MASKLYKYYQEAMSMGFEKLSYPKWRRKVKKRINVLTGEHRLFMTDEYILSFLEKNSNKETEDGVSSIVK